MDPQSQVLPLNLLQFVRHPWKKSPSWRNLERGWFGEGMEQGKEPRVGVSSPPGPKGVCCFFTPKGFSKFQALFPPTGFGPQGVEGHQSPSQLAASSKGEPPGLPLTAETARDAQAHQTSVWDLALPWGDHE